MALAGRGPDECEADGDGVDGDVESDGFEADEADDAESDAEADVDLVAGLADECAAPKPEAVLCGDCDCDCDTWSVAEMVEKADCLTGGAAFGVGLACEAHPAVSTAANALMEPY